MTGINIPVISVSQVNRRIGTMFSESEQLNNIAVRGELVDYKLYPQSGHRYFTLKDENSQLRGFFSKFYASSLKFAPKNGDKVVCYGSVNVYEPRGDYSLRCVKMEPDGMGEQAVALEELKKRLQQQGLFDQKRELPAFPKCVAVVTSDSGAAVEDIKKIISQRCPVIKVIIIPAKVQGVGADLSVAEGIRRAQSTDAEVIIFGRGGGSSDDLSAFNSEVIARAVYASRIPTISAVGHQTDVSIADLAADLRAATPTEAAQCAVPDVHEYCRQMEVTTNKIHSDLMRRMAETERLLDSRIALISALSPRNRLIDAERRLDNAVTKIHGAMHAKLERTERTLMSTAGVISALDPLGVLARGYSLTSNDEGIVRSSSQLKTGDDITVKLSDGSVRATVNEILT